MGYEMGRSEADSEERGNIALGAIDAVVELLQGQAPMLRIDPAKLGYLMVVVQGAVRDAIPSYAPLHGGACNDMDGD